MVVALLRFGGPSPLVDLVHLQRPLWIGCGLLVSAITAVLTRRRGIALAAGLVFLTNPEAFTLQVLPIVIYVLMSVANTALESWTGQIRYRTQFVAFLVCAVAVAVAAARALPRGARAAARSPAVPHRDDDGFPPPPLVTRLAP